jgi:hypothetical protein
MTATRTYKIYCSFRADHINFLAWSYFLHFSLVLRLLWTSPTRRYRRSTGLHRPLTSNHHLLARYQYASPFLVLCIHLFVPYSLLCLLLPCYHLSLLYLLLERCVDTALQVLVCSLYLFALDFHFITDYLVSLGPLLINFEFSDTEYVCELPLLHLLPLKTPS